MNKLIVTTPTDTTIKFERRLNAPRETVFEAFTNADMMKQWFADPENPVTTVESDAREGGQYKLVWNGPDGEMTMSGVYTTFERPTFIQSTEKWEPDWTGGDVLNDIRFEVEGADTLLILVSTYPSNAARDGAKDGAAEGFGTCLDALEALIAN